MHSAHRGQTFGSLWLTEHAGLSVSFSALFEAEMNLEGREWWWQVSCLGRGEENRTHSSRGAWLRPRARGRWRRWCRKTSSPPSVPFAQFCAHLYYFLPNSLTKTSPGLWVPLSGPCPDPGNMSHCQEVPEQQGKTRP